MKIPQANLKLSKMLRTNQTPWEAKLWMHLRANILNGMKFKRQVPIGKYIADFCCDEKKLVIELDGGQHNEASIAEIDQEKERFLQQEGYIVLRFWNNEIEQNLEGVISKINEMVNSDDLSQPAAILFAPGEGKRVATSPPPPPHAWGGGLIN